MIKSIQANLYLVSGKPMEIITAGQVREDSDKLLQYEDKIAQLLADKSDKKVNVKKKVYFVFFEGDYLESKNTFKNETEFNLTLMEYSPAEFKKLVKKYTD